MPRRIAESDAPFSILTSSRAAIAHRTNRLCNDYCVRSSLPLAISLLNRGHHDDAARPLDGVRVLELARSQAGPRGGMILSDLLAEVIKIEPPVEEIWAALGEAGVPVGPVRTIPEVARDPHLWDRQMLVKMDDPVAGEMYLPGVTIKMSKTPGRIGPVPTPGQHTDEIISSVLGYDLSALSNLRSAGAIA